MDLESCVHSLVLHGFLFLQVFKFHKKTGESSWVTEVIRMRTSPIQTLKANKVMSADEKHRAEERAKMHEAVMSLRHLEEVWPGMEVTGVVTRYGSCLELK